MSTATVEDHKNAVCPIGLEFYAHACAVAFSESLLHPAKIVCSCHVCPIILRYAECLASKLLITNVSSHMKLIRRGIRDVRGAADKLRSVAGWQALQATLLGSLEIKVGEWKRAVDMQGRGGERSTTSSTADNFWRAVDSLSNEDRRKLLFFWTAESPPAAGLSHLDRRMTLRIDTSLAPNQPRAATCFYSLEIPVLSSRSAAEKLVKTCVAHWNTWGHE